MRGRKPTSSSLILPFRYLEVRFVRTGTDQQTHLERPGVCRPGKGGRMGGCTLRCPLAELLFPVPRVYAPPHCSLSQKWHPPPGSSSQQPEWGPSLPSPGPQIATAQFLLSSGRAASATPQGVHIHPPLLATPIPRFLNLT